MDSIFLYTLGVAAFIVALVVSVGLHELGHFIPAKKFGVKVTQYFIGFGPTLWSRKKGETEYGVKALPLGGFVKIQGMLPPVDGFFDEKTGKHVEGSILRNSNTGMFTSLIAAARKSEYEKVELEDRDRMLYRLPWWKKLIVMASGPLVNIVIAFFCFFFVFTFIGQRTFAEPVGAPVLQKVALCAEGVYGQDNTTACPRGSESPAKLAGFKPGDRLVAVNGSRITDWRALQKLIGQSSNEKLIFQVERAGKTIELSPTIKPFQRPNGDNTGTELKGYLGVTPQFSVIMDKSNGGVMSTLHFMGTTTVDTIKSLAHLPNKVWHVGRAILGLEERDPNGPVSIVGGARISGEVASYDGYDQTLPDTWSAKIASFILLVGGFNLFVGIFNLVPLAPLDGGHMAGSLWEGLKKFAARITRREFRPVDVAKTLPLSYAFMLVLMGMGILLIVGDLVVPVSIHP